MSMGALIGSPVVGYSLDRWGVWVPMSVTSLCCSGGCLWRGVARGLGELRLGGLLFSVILLFIYIKFVYYYIFILHSFIYSFIYLLYYLFIIFIHSFISYNIITPPQ